LSVLGVGLVLQSGKSDDGYGVKHRIGMGFCGSDVGFVGLEEREVKASTKYRRGPPLSGDERSRDGLWELGNTSPINRDAQF
jgi:hypothetical protein